MAEITITNENFEQEVLKSDIPVLVDFWAEWCGPCKMLGPVIDELSGEYEGKVSFFKLDVDDNQDLASEYGINSIPNLIFFKKGEKVSEAVGFKPAEDLKTWIEGNI